MNFRLVGQDLGAGHPLAERLNTAVAQEMQHARLLRDMLSSLGYVNPRELIALARAVYRGQTEGQHVRWHPDLHPWARIYFNYRAEGYFDRIGLERMTNTVLRLATMMGSNDLARGTLAFFDCVQPQEREHVQLCRDVMAVYEDRYHGFPLIDLIDRIRFRGSAWFGVLRSSHAFYKAMGEETRLAPSPAMV